MTDADWRRAFEGWLPQEMIEKSTPQQIVAEIRRQLRQLDWLWREEIAKYLPQIEVQSFCGPKSTIRWLMGQVEMKPDSKELAEKLQAIEASDATEENKVNERLLTIFPNLGKDNPG